MVLEKNPELGKLFHYEPQSGIFSFFDLTKLFQQVKFETIKQLPHGASAFQMNGKAFVSGGRDSPDIKQMRKLFSELTELTLDGNYAEHTGMKEGRHRHSLTGSSQSKILFVSGGELSNRKPTRSVQIYQLSKKSWKGKASSLFQARQDHASCFTQKGSFVYVFCGTVSNRNSDSLNTIERYDVELNKWEKIPSNLKKDSNLFAICTRQNTFIIFGGREKNAEVVEYQPKSGEMTLRGVRTFFAGPQYMAQSLGRTVYTIGRNLEDNRKKYLFKLKPTGWLPLKSLQEN